MRTLLFMLLSGFLLQTPTIENDKHRWRPYYTNTAPAKIAEKWFLPFEGGDRKSVKNLKIISIFGDHRDSYLKGHIHTAIDVNPAIPKDKLVGVYGIRSKSWGSG